MLQNIDALVQQEIKNINVDAIFQEELRKQLAETVRRVLKDALGPFSPFTKKLEEAIKETMKFDPSKLELPEYSNFVVEQTCLVIKDLMSEERAANMKTHIIEKLAPNLAKEIEFDDFVSKLREILMEAYEEGDDASTAPEYTITVEQDSNSYSREYWNIEVKEGKDSMVRLFTTGEGECYHTNGSRTSEPISKLFATYKYNRTKIKGIEAYSKTITIEDTY